MSGGEVRFQCSWPQNLPVAPNPTHGALATFYTEPVRWSQHTSLDLVDNHDDVVLLGNVAKALEECSRGVVVTTLALDGLDNQAGHGELPRLDELLHLVEASLLLGGVVGLVLVERVLECREGSLRPVEGRDIQLVDGL